MKQIWIFVTLLFSLPGVCAQNFYGGQILRANGYLFRSEIKTVVENEVEKSIGWRISKSEDQGKTWGVIWDEGFYSRPIGQFLGLSFQVNQSSIFVGELYGDRYSPKVIKIRSRALSGGIERILKISETYAYDGAWRSNFPLVQSDIFNEKVTFGVLDQTFIVEGGIARAVTTAIKDWMFSFSREPSTRGTSFFGCQGRLFGVSQVDIGRGFDWIVAGLGNDRKLSDVVAYGVGIPTGISAAAPKKGKSFGKDGVLLIGSSARGYGRDAEMAVLVGEASHRKMKMYSFTGVEDQGYVGSDVTVCPNGEVFYLGRNTFFEDKPVYASTSEILRVGTQGGTVWNTSTIWKEPGSVWHSVLCNTDNKLYISTSTLVDGAFKPVVRVSLDRGATWQTY